MRQVLRAGALGRPRGIRWRGRWEGGSGWRIQVNPWLIHVNVWQKPLQCCKVISLQLIKINGKKKYLYVFWWFQIPQRKTGLLMCDFGFQTKNKLSQIVSFKPFGLLMYKTTKLGSSIDLTVTRLPWVENNIYIFSGIKYRRCLHYQASY